MKPINETEILNTALSLALEWSEHWLQPIQSRLAKHYPQLSAEALDDYNNTAQKVMRFGWKTIEEFDFMNNTKATKNFEEYRRRLLETYP